MSDMATPHGEFVFANHARPHFQRPERSVNSLIFQMFALLGLLQGVAAATLLAAGPAGQAIVQGNGQIDVWGNAQLLGICFLGSSLGTTLKLTFFPIPELHGLTGITLVRILAGKATVSMVCGLVVSPMALRYMEWTHDRDTLIAVSTAIAFLADVTLGIGVTAWQKWVTNKTNDFAGGNKQ
jgi:hypothetical protein